MSNEADLAAELDAAIGDGPAHPPPDVALAAGRRRLRRRRLAGGAGLAAAAAVVAVALVGGSGSDRADRGVDPAAPGGSATSAEPTRSPSPAPSEPTSPPRIDPEQLLAGDAVALTPDGRLVTAPGVKVLRRVPNPYGYQPPNHSLGISYRYDGETTWALLDHTVDRDGYASGSTASDPAGKAFARLEDWLADQVAINTDQDPAFTFVEFRGPAGETLRPLAGVEILQQTGDVDLPRAFAGPRDRTAVAQVVWQGRRWWVLARQLPGSPPEYLSVDAAVGGATLPGFLDHARRQYAGGEGMR